ncbi:DUF4376 domain-containing protein [Halomonas sp. H33-56]|uniref:DUF4376 domain-containing protein n=1 Tax=Halomonas sp. H33-56 TaxID=2950873 RepID=UPI0032DE833A
MDTQEMYYSAELMTFLPGSLRDEYERSGTWPDDAIKVTVGEWQTYGQGDAPTGMQRGSDADGRPTWIKIPPEPLKDLAARKRSEIEAGLSAALYAGMPHTMPGGTDDVVQTRPEDEPNLLGLAIEARDLRDAGETGAVQVLRAQSNVLYAMTPEQMIAVTDAAKAFKKQQLAHSWTRKDEIEAALEAGDRAALEVITW